MVVAGVSAGGELQIDHLVWYCGDLEAGRGLVAHSLGIDPAYGGEHPGEGTANYLIALGPSTYLEILGRDPAQDQSTIDPAVGGLRGLGLYHWAMSGVALEKLQARARTAKLRGGALVGGGRTKPDGQRLDWTCFGLRDHQHGALLPFFIDWHETRHPATTSPAGAQLADFEVFSPEAASLQATYDALGIPIKVSQRGKPGFSATLQSRHGKLELHSFLPVPAGYII